MHAWISFFVSHIASTFSLLAALHVRPILPRLLRRIYSSAHIQPRYRRVVVANLRIEIRPRIDVDVLKLRPALLSQRRRYKHVVELLRIHVEQIGIPLNLVGSHHGIQVLEARNIGILAQGLHKGKLIKVACRHDAGVLVLGKDSLFSLVSVALVTAYTLA